MVIQTLPPKVQVPPGEEYFSRVVGSGMILFFRIGQGLLHMVELSDEHSEIHELKPMPALVQAIRENATPMRFLDYVDALSVACDRIFNPQFQPE